MIIFPGNDNLELLTNFFDKKYLNNPYTNYTGETEEFAKELCYYLASKGFLICEENDLDGG